MSMREEALAYHRRGRPGKIEIRCTKPTATQRDLSLAYSPGVAEPCLDIAENPERVGEYTSRSNLVAVVSNGSAVLGLGNIGPRAGKPVMEGKAVLFKRFADIDVFDIEIDAPTPTEFIETVRRLEPTFGGINIEDVRAPECFEIEPALEKAMDIPVFHDDQHGTAIISGAGLINACQLVGKKPEDCRMVINGAGASAISGAKLYETLGFKHENILLCDSKGLIYEGRENVNQYKQQYAHPFDGMHSLAEAVKDADILIGLSAAGAFTPDMLKSMATNPIVFALANPWPEIMPEDAAKARDDVIMGTGRTDYPNQINNVLGFPFIFRGALDTRARGISDAMKVAAARSLAALAREDVPESVSRAYGGEQFAFGRDYVIPKPFDPRVLVWVSHAVARAAIESGMARRDLNLDQYREELEQRLDLKRAFVTLARRKSQANRPSVIFPQPLDEKMVRGLHEISDQRIANPVLLGNPTTVGKRIRELGVKLQDADIVEPRNIENFSELVQIYQNSLGRGTNAETARQDIVNDPLLCATLMLEAGRAHALVATAETSYPQAARKVLRIVGTRSGYRHATGMHVVRLRDRTLFFADTTLNIAPDPETLADIGIATANAARRFEVDPVVGMVSFANFGESEHPEARKVAEAVKIIRVREPNLPVIGEIQADWAVSPDEFDIPEEHRLDQPANVLVFPNLSAANAAFRLARVLADGEVIGPIILGLRRAVGLLPRGATVAEIVRMTAMCGLEARANPEALVSSAPPR